MIDHVAAYGGIANGGRRVQPWAIVKVTDSAGKVIEDKRSRTTIQAIPSNAAGTLTSILKGAVPPYYGLDFPVAGKSGTTEHWTDSWFLGYTTDLVVGAWMGHTDEHSAHMHMNVVYGENGAGLMMRDFFKAWYSGGKPSDFPPVSIRPCGSRAGSDQAQVNAQAPAPAPASASEPTAPYEFPTPGTVASVAPTWEPRGPYVPHPVASPVCAPSPQPSPSPTSHPDTFGEIPPVPGPVFPSGFPFNRSPDNSPRPYPRPTCYYNCN
jgi:membrane peptidoglycan carboxypeptidase